MPVPKMVVSLLAALLRALPVAGPLPHFLSARRDKFEFAISDTRLSRHGQPIHIRSGEMHFARGTAGNIGRIVCVCSMPPASMRYPTYIFLEHGRAEAGTVRLVGPGRRRGILPSRAERGAHGHPPSRVPTRAVEWEFGGFPWWLLKHKDIQLRAQDAYYLQCVQAYLHEVGRVLAPLQVSRGGPIILVQVENEYGSYGKDRVYMGKVRDFLKEAGFDGPFYTSDGPSELKNDVRDDIFSTVNGEGFDKLREIRPQGPLMCGEFYPGWFDSWGLKHHTTSADEAASFIDDLLKKNISFSMYMAHGGTSFGLWSGANCPPFRPTDQQLRL